VSLFIGILVKNRVVNKSCSQHNTQSYLFMILYTCL